MVPFSLSNIVGKDFIAASFILRNSSSISKTALGFFLVGTGTGVISAINAPLE